MKIIKHTNDKMVIDSENKRESQFKYIMNIYKGENVVGSAKIYPDSKNGYGIFYTKQALSRFSDSLNIPIKELSFNFTEEYKS